jgi:hypothetical protein
LSSLFAAEIIDDSNRIRYLSSLFALENIVFLLYLPQKSLSIQTVVFLFIWRENQFQIEPFFSSLFVTKSYTNRGVPFFFICCGNHSLILPYLSSVSVAEILFKS